jgi:hypothetical protein
MSRAIFSGEKAADENVDASVSPLSEFPELSEMHHYFVRPLGFPPPSTRLAKWSSPAILCARRLPTAKNAASRA